MNIVQVGIAEDLDIARAVGDAQLVTRDAGEGLEGRTGRPPALRAMTVHGVAEFVGHGVAHTAAEADAGKLAAVGGGLIATRISHR